MIEVTSANRSPAKRLLNNWHDSRAVRTWRLDELSAALNRAITDGLITREGVERVLNAEPEKTKGGKAKAGTAGGQSETEAEVQTGNDGVEIDGGESGEEYRDANGEAESAGDGESSGAGSDTDSPHYQQGKQDAEDGKPRDSEYMAEDAEEPARQEYERGYNEGSESRESNDKPNGKEKQNGKGNGQDQSEQSMPFDPSIVQEMIDRALAEHKKNDGHAVRRVIIKDSKTERKVDGAHVMLPDVLRYIKAGLNVALVGPAGTGKSTIAHQCADILEKEFRGCGALLSKYDLVGFIDAGGTYHETPLYDAYTNGHLFCFDELDASAPDAVVAFNAITDNQNIYAFPNGMHAKHEGFVAVACMNTWGSGADADYVGRFKQDAASMSRFVRVYIDYDQNIESQLGDKDIVARVWSLREACKTLGIRHVVSTRMIIQAQGARDVGTDNKTIDRDILFAGLTESTIKQIAAQMKKGA